MAKPSLKATPQGIQLAKQALTRAGWVQRDLSQLVGCSRQPITNFFKGEAIAQSIFLKICDRLDLAWQTVAGLTDAAGDQGDEPTIAIEAIVQPLRSQVYDSIQERCGTMRILDMTYPIGIDDIYTDVNIFEQIAGRTYKRLEELIEALQAMPPDEFDRFGFNRISQARVSGIAAVQRYSKLVLLGKPGAGKTTFLKHLAIQCNQGKFAADRVPIFVTLKDFAESEPLPLLEYIATQDFNSYMPPALADRRTQQINDFYQVLSAGRALILLDGLDEVRQEDCDRILKEIRDFSDQFRSNHFVITCRIAAWEYAFEKFTEVEVADFDSQQISTFATHWFRDKSIQPTAFLKTLEANSRIRQLAVSPLLLTLLCLAFEESGNCSPNRSDLYKEGIDALLKKWDAKRGIQRDQIYRQLSHQRKEDLLSAIALQTFRRGEYFFKQRQAEQYITDYICQLSGASDDPEILQLDSEVILRAIEAQHGLLVERAKGIYSFSHLTFQEYFTAREIVLKNPELNRDLQDLISRLTDKRWREVFLLATEMLRDASQLLLPLKAKVDSLLAEHPQLQQYLADVQKQSAQSEFSFCKPAAVRAFFFDIDFSIDQNRLLAFTLDRQINLFVCASYFTRMLEGVTLIDGIAIAQAYDQAAPAEKIVDAPSVNAAMMIAIQIVQDSKQLVKDQNQQEQLPHLLQLDSQAVDDEEMQEIADQARSIAKSRYRLSQVWLDPTAKELLRQYYSANLLLVECLDQESYLKHETRQQIEDALLLPIESLHSTCLLRSPRSS